LDFRARLLELDARAIDASRNLAEEEDVLLSIDGLEASLDRLVAAIPVELR
jgi:hypothetical protein